MINIQDFCPRNAKKQKPRVPGEGTYDFARRENKLATLCERAENPTKQWRKIIAYKDAGCET